MKFLLGKKLGMTTIEDAENGAQNVTLIECQDNTVRLVRTPEKDGYVAVQLELPKTKKRVRREEFRLDSSHVSKEEAAKELETYQAGTLVSVSAIAVGDIVSVSGITKAKGFQGVVKRHGFKGSPRTHGRKHDLRAPGSIGAVWPQHVIKGMRMAGRMGGVKSTSRNLKVVYVNPESKLIGVKGAVPGIPGGIVAIRTKVTH